MSSRQQGFRPTTHLLSAAIATIAVLIAITPLTAHSQRISFGAELSGTFVSMDFANANPSVDVAGRLSGSAAAIAAFLFESFELQGGLRYSRLGSVRNFAYELPERGPDGSVIGSTRETGNTTISLHYLSADLRARYDVWPGKLFVVAGPELGYLLSAQAVTILQSRPGNPHRESHTENMKRINLFAKAGVGIPFRMGGREGYVQMLYARGLFSVSEHPVDSAVTSELAVSLGVRF